MDMIYIFRHIHSGLAENYETGQFQKSQLVGGRKSRCIYYPLYIGADSGPQTGNPHENQSQKCPNSFFFSTGQLSLSQ